MQDAEAIQRCRQGEAEAFRHLVYRYQRRALAHARALIGNDADAADAAQDAFLDAFRNLRRFDESREFYPWFYVLLRNRCHKQRARARDRPSTGEPIEPAAPAPDPLEDLHDLRVALDRLPIDDRELIVLKHLDGWTYDELAERLGIPRGTVMSRLFHARQRLQGLDGPRLSREDTTMTTGDSPRCAEVRMAALARLDGESADLSSEEIDGHIAGCRACQARHGRPHGVAPFGSGRWTTSASTWISGRARGPRLERAVAAVAAGALGASSD